MVAAGMAEVVEEAEHAGIGGGDAGGLIVEGRFLDGEELDAVAGGEDEGFANAGLVGEGAGGIGEAGGGDGEALAHVEGRGVVVDAEEDRVG